METLERWCVEQARSRASPHLRAAAAALAVLVDARDEPVKKGLVEELAQRVARLVCRRARGGWLMVLRMGEQHVIDDRRVTDG